MKFTMLESDLARIMTIAGAMVDKKGTRPTLAGIGCKIEDDKLIATGLDGYRCIEMIVPIKINELSDMTQFIIEPMKGYNKKSNFIVELEISDNDVTYVSALGKITKPLIKGTFFNTHDLFEVYEPLQDVYFNPKLLMEMLKALSDDTMVKLTFPKKQTSPILIETVSNIKGILLPCRPPREDNR